MRNFWVKVASGNLGFPLLNTRRKFEGECRGFASIQIMVYYLTDVKAGLLWVKKFCWYWSLLLLPTVFKLCFQSFESAGIFFSSEIQSIHKNQIFCSVHLVRAIFWNFILHKCCICESDHDFELLDLTYIWTYIIQAYINTWLYDVRDHGFLYLNNGYLITK